MNTKFIMTSSATFLALTGIGCTFMPLEILHYLQMDETKSLQIFLQILGSLYFSFAMLNWMTKSGLIGGIYNRPIAVANFTHFAIGGLALIKGITSQSGIPLMLLFVTCFYVIYGIAFTLILFRHPIPKK